jgi:lipoprotein-releasing system permease protein
MFTDESANSYRAVRFILFRYLISSWMARRMRSRGTIGVFFPMLGVALGVCAFVVVLSVMAGFVHNLEGKLLAIDSHIEIVVKDSFGFVEADPLLLAEIKRVSTDIVGVSPFQRGDAIIQSSARPSTIVLYGVDVDRGRLSSDLESKFLGQDLSVLKGTSTPTNIEPSGSFPSVVVGSQILRHIGSEVGDRLTLVSVTADEGPAGLAPRQFPIVVADELRSGNPIFDNKLVVADLDFVNEFFDTRGMWAGVQVKVRDPLNLDPLVSELNKALEPRKLRAKPWTEANQAFVKALKLERWAMKMVMFMVILVACFSISIILVLAVRRKAREMAILRALGMRRGQLGVIFLLHGMLIGLIGVVIGLALSFGILELVRGNFLGFVTSAYSDKPLPVLVNWRDVCFLSIGSVFLAALASVLPALEVMRIDVLETISERG